MTAGGTLLLLACAALVAWTCWRVAACSRLPRVGDVLVATGVLTLAVPLATVLVVGGVLRSLSAVPVALATVALALVTGAVTGSGGRRDRVAATRRATRAAVAGSLRSAVRAPLVLVLALGAVVAVGYRVAIAVRFPALDWDGLAYHLPMADSWLQEERLLVVPFSFWAQVHPGAAEAVVAWTGALTGSVRAAAAVQVWAAVVGAVAVAALCRGAGASVRSSLVGGLLFVLAPIVLVQLSTAEVDVVAAAALLATWHLLLVALARPAGPHDVPLPPLVLAGVGAGVAMGVKLTNLLAAGALGLVLCAAVLWQQRTARRRVRALVAAAAAYGVPALALGGYWYVRNAVHWGNPFYPVAVAGLPGNPAVVGLVGTDPAHVGTSNRFWALLVSWASDLEWRTYFYGSPTGGLGAHWLLVLVPAAVVGAVLLARSGRALHVWVLFVPGVVLLLAFPGGYRTRYTLFVVALGAVGLAVVLDRLRPWLRQALLAVTAGAALFSAAAASWQALDVSGDFESGATPAEVLALMRAPEAEREAVGLRGAFVDVERAPAGSVFVVPPEFGSIGQPWVLPHSMWGDDLTRDVVMAETPLDSPAAAERALERYDADYVVVTKGSALEQQLEAAGGPLRPAFEVGWLARAWAAQPAGG